MENDEIKSLASHTQFPPQLHESEQIEGGILAPFEVIAALK